MNPHDVTDKADVASQQADVAMDVTGSAASATRASAATAEASQGLFKLKEYVLALERRHSELEDFKKEAKDAITTPIDENKKLSEDEKNINSDLAKFHHLVSWLYRNGIFDIEATLATFGGQ